jgi:hypothetical protein
MVPFIYRCPTTGLNVNYHIPISNTAAATVVLENHKEAERRAA